MRKTIHMSIMLIQMGSRGSVQFSASRLDLVIRESGNPEAPLDYATRWLECIFRAGINKPKEAFDDFGSSAIALKVD